MTPAMNLSGNLQALKEKMAAAAGRAKQNPGQIRIMAVTKNFPVEYVQAALSCGITLFGENRVQEAALKYSSLVQKPELHLIGHLQRNKAKTAVSLFACIQSVDKLETALAIDKEAAGIHKTAGILVEINTSGETSKSGLRDEAGYFMLLDKILKLTHVEVKGLMTVGPLTDNTADSRRAFACLRELYRKTREQYAIPGFELLSMGMSSDFEIAIEEGANLIRIGTALFGNR